VTSDAGTKIEPVVDRIPVLLKAFELPNVQTEEFIR
jgi:hypothetical protein